ncbi:hypothetical protein R3I94_020149 [Phoxinus phoxinus]
MHITMNKMTKKDKEKKNRRLLFEAFHVRSCSRLSRVSCVLDTDRFSPAFTIGSPSPSHSLLDHPSQSLRHTLLLSVFRT